MANFTGTCDYVTVKGYYYCEPIHALPQCPVRRSCPPTPSHMSSSCWVEVSEWHADFFLTIPRYGGKNRQQTPRRVTSL